MMWGRKMTRSYSRSYANVPDMQGNWLRHWQFCDLLSVPCIAP